MIFFKNNELQMFHHMHFNDAHKVLSNVNHVMNKKFRLASSLLTMHCKLLNCLNGLEY